MTTGLARIIDHTTGEVVITDDARQYVTNEARAYVENTGEGDARDLADECCRDANAMRSILGLTVETADVVDVDALDDQEWADWVAAHLQRGVWTDGRVVVSGGAGFDPGITDRWPGGAILVKAVHGSRMNAWRAIDSWPGLRAMVETVDEEEAEALEDLARERAAEAAHWQPLRDAQAAVEAAERALRDARADRDRQVRTYLADGATAYRVAQVTGLSNPTVAKIRGAK